MDMLREIQRDMAFIGWKGEPSTGFSHKEDVNGATIAKHHDSTWIADVEECSARAERKTAREELERRAATTPPPLTGLVCAEGEK